MATWTTTEIPAYHLAVGDQVDLHNRYTITLNKADDRGGGVFLEGADGHGEVWRDVPAGEPVTVHVPDEPVDGYNLWRPNPGTWPYSQCTCVHRRDTDGNWQPIGHDCPACTARATDNWED